MQRDALIDKLKEFEIYSQSSYIRKAFARNIGLLTQYEQQLLSNATVAIPGMGGVGGVHLITLTRTGVGRFHLADFDRYDPVNVNRQYGATIPGFGSSKLDVMKEHALSINPYLEFKEFPEGISTDTIDDFLDGVDVVLDSLDFFEFDIRRLLFNRAREKGIYVVTAGPIGFSSAMLIFAPDKGMSFDEYFDIHVNMLDTDKYLAYGLGLAPGGTHIKYMDLSKVDLKKKAGPSLNISCQLCSGMAATEVIRIILKKDGIKSVPHYVQFDAYQQKYCKGKLVFGNRNPWQRFKKMWVTRILEKEKQNYELIIPEEPINTDRDGILTTEALEFILKAGIQAPSGDNAQPWKFQTEENTIHLYLDREADNSFFNINQIASIISCGAVLENIKIAASAFGMEVSMDYLPNPTHKDLMATVHLQLTAAKRDPLADFIWHRKTNRKPYSTIPLPTTISQELNSSIADIPGTHIHCITKPQQLKQLAQLIFKVDQIRSEHQGLHEHLGKMIRFSHHDAIRARDGLPIQNLEAGPEGEIFLKLTKPWKVMNALNKIGFSKIVASHSRKAIRRSTGAILITVDGTNTEDFLKGGQAVERAWITLSQKGIACQPMTAITLFWLRWTLKGEQDFAIKHRCLLQNLWQDYHNLFQTTGPGQEGHVMLLRMGYGKDIKYGTYRKGVNYFLSKSFEANIKA